MAFKPKIVRPNMATARVMQYGPDFHPSSDAISSTVSSHPPRTIAGDAATGPCPISGSEYKSRTRPRRAKGDRFVDAELRPTSVDLGLADVTPVVDKQAPGWHLQRSRAEKQRDHDDEPLV